MSEDVVAPQTLLLSRALDKRDIESSHLNLPALTLMEMLREVFDHARVMGRELDYETIRFAEYWDEPTPGWVEYRVWGSTK